MISHNIAYTSYGVESWGLTAEVWRRRLDCPALSPNVPPMTKTPSKPPGDVAELLATLPAPRGSLQEVQKNMPIRIAAMQPHCSSIIRSRSTSAAKASVTSG